MAKQKWTTTDIADQSGKVIIITGANSGIGYETALAMAEKGAQVVMACRNQQKAEDAAAQIRKQHPDAQLDLIPLDLSDLESVKTFAETFRGKYDRLDILCNNAGLMAIPYAQTTQGHEMQFGVNHLGHFALTALLYDILKGTAQSRIVSVSSMMHKFGKINFDDLNSEKSYSKQGAYGQSKLSNLLFTYELQRRLETSGVEVIATAAHPGWTSTNLQDESPLFKLMNPFAAQKPYMGALPTLYAMLAEVDGGAYIGPGGFMETRGYPKIVPSTKNSHNLDHAKRLWAASEELTGVSFAV